MMMAVLLQDEDDYINEDGAFNQMLTLRCTTGH